MSSKHTPGPWEVSHGGHGSPHGFVIDEYYVLNRTVADDVAIAADIVDPATQMPSEANARLIAAAPELLEALKGLLDDVQGLMSESEGVAGLHRNGDVADWASLDEGGRFERLSNMSAAIAAIAKATGGAQ